MSRKAAPPAPVHQSSAGAERDHLAMRFMAALMGAGRADHEAMALDAIKAADVLLAALAAPPAPTESEDE